MSFRLYFGFRVFLHNFSSFLSWIDARKINLQSTNTKVALWCQPTTAFAERSFFVLNKFLAKDRNFIPQNVKTLHVCSLYFKHEVELDLFHVFSCLAGTIFVLLLFV